MADIEKRTVSWATMLKVFFGLIIAAIVVIFAGFVYVNARQLRWTLGWIYVGINQHVNDSPNQGVFLLFG